MLGALARNSWAAVRKVEVRTIGGVEWLAGEPIRESFEPGR